MLRGLSLFSGIAGIDRGLHDWVRTVCYCERDPYCQAVLLSRMASGEIDRAPIWDDITTFNGKDWNGSIDIVFGGFPCQDISVAGHGKGLAGERSGLFFEIARIAGDLACPYIFLENVPAITKRGGREVVGTFTKMGYDCRWCVISAASVGALHKRERWFLLAHAKHNGSFASEGGRSFGTQPDTGRQQQQEEDSRETERTSCISADVAYASCHRLEAERSEQQTTRVKRKSDHVANTESQRCEGQWPISERNEASQSEPSSIGNKVGICDTNSKPSEQANTCAESKQDERRAWGRHTGQHWPFESREHWKEVKPEFRGVFNGIPIRMDTNENKGLNAYSNKKRSSEELFNLWSDIYSQKIWEAFRRSQQIFNEEILFPEMQWNSSHDRFSLKTNNREEKHKIQEKVLRTLQNYKEFSNSSYRQESSQQYCFELNDALLFLSYIIASQTRGYCTKERIYCLSILSQTIYSTRLMFHASCSIEETWSSFGQEEKDWQIMASIFGIWWEEWPGIPRADDLKIENRTNRLRALGNSCVPAQCKKAFQILSGIDMHKKPENFNTSEKHEQERNI